MKDNSNNSRNGYLETINKGIRGVRAFKDLRAVSGKGTHEENIRRLMSELETADAVVIGAGAGLSTSAGMTYSGERFERYFFDFAEKFGITDMYSGGFYPFPDAETRWAWWARHIYFNRYVPTPKPVYDLLYELVKDKNYFVITTNVDHRFQFAGFEKSRLFYTQGDYGLFQKAGSGASQTWDNEDWTMRAMAAQGFVRDADGIFQVPEDGKLKMRIPTEMIPRCPDDGSELMMNLRSDDTFAEDEGWQRASAAYAAFLDQCADKHVLYLELGVGSNTPVIIKYPFWQMTAANPKAVYACLNYGEAFTVGEIESRSICIDEDIGEVFRRIRN